MSLFQKKLVITLGLVFTIAFLFWTGSRYPQLDAKALMGGDSPTMGISFDIVKEVNDEQSTIKQILFNTLNWVDTNKKGMTFGFLFGAAFILLFSIIKDYSFKNRFLNTAFGAIVGAPLGVCVNCAAPIAKGMKDAGARTETALATMITSPTMNVIVLSILFALLPIYMVWLKIAFTLLMIFLVIPLVSQLFEGQKVQSKEMVSSRIKLPTFNIPIDETDKLNKGNWGNAFMWILKGYFKSLWFIVKTTLPLMILAGLLGNILVTFLPLDSLISLVKNLSIFEKGLYMLGIAIFATFLPVPIAFDVIITAILWSAGLHTRYAVILLFCLGTYSIYSAFIVGKSFSLKLAFVLFIITAVFGFSAGVLGHFLENKMGLEYRIDQYELLSESSQGPQYLTFNYEFEEPNHAKRNQNSFNFNEYFQTGDLKIKQAPFFAKDTSLQESFKVIEGIDIGLKVPYHFSVKETVEPFANQRSISAADYNQDRFVDLLFTSASQLYLYQNQGGKGFKKAQIPDLSNYDIFNSALVDLNNDGFQEIVFSTFREGNYLIVNDSGQFNNELIRLPQLEDAIISLTLAFDDVDLDGHLDIILGNWSIGSLGAAEYTMHQSKNVWLKNKGDFKFEVNPLEATAGETLSILCSDINQDKLPDLLIGNDYNVPDYYYLKQNGNAPYKLIKDVESLVERSTHTTMSITTADINNDLKNEILQVQIDRSSGDGKTQDIDQICSGIQSEKELANCRKIMQLQQKFLNATLTRNFEQFEDQFKIDAIAADLVRSHKKNEALTKPCQYFPESWEDFRFICELSRANNTSYPRVKAGGYQEMIKGAVLLKENSKGFYESVAEQFGIGNVGWAWNSKFADLDNDGWQDLMVANGFMFTLSQESNVFYKNIEGKRFEDQTQDMNLGNYLPTSSYAYVDFDLDGDLDLILCTSIGPVYLYENQMHQNHSIAFGLEDEIGNQSGIGAELIIYYGDNEHQKREIILSGGFKSFDPTEAYFGLGKHQQIEKIEINWYDGTKSEITTPLKTGYKYIIQRRGSNSLQL